MDSYYDVPVSNRQMKPCIKLGFVVFVVSACCFGWYIWRKDEPRRLGISKLSEIQKSLATSDNACLTNIVLPPALAGLSQFEQAEFIKKALRDEITPAGIYLLKAKGKFGPLKELFPTEAQRWASSVNVNPDNCVAFRIDQRGIRTEVVLVIEGGTFRLIRCNNVRDLSGKS